MGFVEDRECDLGWRMGERSDLVEEVLGLRRGEKVGGERMVSIVGIETERIREFEEGNSWRVYGDDELRGRSERSFVCFVLAS